MLHHSDITMVTQAFCQLHICAHLCCANIPEAFVRGDDGWGAGVVALG